MPEKEVSYSGGVVFDGQCSLVDCPRKVKENDIRVKSVHKFMAENQQNSSSVSPDKNMQNRQQLSKSSCNRCTGDSVDPSLLNISTTGSTFQADSYFGLGGLSLNAIQAIKGCLPT